MSAQTSQLLQPETKKISHSNLRAWVQCDQHSDSRQDCSLVKWNKRRMANSLLEESDSALCRGSHLSVLIYGELGYHIVLQKQPLRIFFCHSIPGATVLQGNKKGCSQTWNNGNVTTRRQRIGEVTEGRAWRSLTPFLKDVPKKQMQLFQQLHKPINTSQ